MSVSYLNGVNPPTLIEQVLLAGSHYPLELVLICFSVLLGLYVHFCPHHKRIERVDPGQHSVQKQIAAKARLRSRHLSAGRGTGTADVGPGESQVVPPGQSVVKRWVVLDLGLGCNREMYSLWERPGEWRLKVTGLRAGGSVALTLEALTGMGLAEYNDHNFHCVTGWSALGLGFRGVPFPVFARAVAPVDDWAWLYQVSADGYTTVVSREDIDNAETFVAVQDHNGELIEESHGGVRVLCPSLYGYKSAKYLTEVRFLPHYEKGFWEKLGCHARGRAFREERWSAEMSAVWRVLFWCIERYRLLLGARVWLAVMDLGGRGLGLFVRATAAVTGLVHARPAPAH